MSEQTTHNHKHPQKKFCPVCFLPVQGDEVLLGQDIALHSFAGCLMAWARMDRDSHAARAVEALRLADPKSWQARPQATGNYWARRSDSDIFSNVTILRGVRGLVVKCGSTLQEMTSLEGYSFLPREVTHHCEAA